jgi:hypothetical protein
MRPSPYNQAYLYTIPTTTASLVQLSLTVALKVSTRTKPLLTGSRERDNVCFWAFWPAPAEGDVPACWRPRAFLISSSFMDVFALHLQLFQKTTMRSLLSLALVGFAAEAAHAIPNSAPEPTLASENVYDAFGWTPAPTDAPSLELLKRGAGHNLVARALTSGELLGYVAPDSMCGYISGSIGTFQARFRLPLFIPTSMKLIIIRGFHSLFICFPMRCSGTLR